MLHEGNEDQGKYGKLRLIDRLPMHSNSYGSRGIDQDWQPDFS